MQNTREDFGDSLSSLLQQSMEKMVRQARRKAIEHDFTYHPPKPGQPERYQNIRELAKSFALFIADKTPLSREQSLALTALEECVFWANAAIARNEE